jgi:hypothetical protein
MSITKDDLVLVCRDTADYLAGENDDALHCLACGATGGWRMASHGKARLLPKTIEHGPRCPVPVLREAVQAAIA